MTYVVIVIVIIAVAMVAIVNTKRNKTIHENGVEVDAVVSRIREVRHVDDDGDSDVSYEYYVRFQAERGETVEAKLGNPPVNITEGTQLRVKYLPDKPKYALAI